MFSQSLKKSRFFYKVLKRSVAVPLSFAIYHLLVHDFIVAMATTNFVHIWSKINYFGVIVYFFFSFLHKIPEIQQVVLLISTLA